MHLIYPNHCPVFHIIATPHITFAKYFAIVWTVFFAVYGLSSVVSMLVKREDASLLSVIVCLFAAVFNGFGPSITEGRTWGIGFIL